MPGSIDSAILRALSLDANSVTFKSHGSGGFASTLRLSGPNVDAFVKTSSAESAKIMFEGEHMSLNALWAVENSICPRSFAWGKLDSGGYFLATEFLDFTSSTMRSGSGMNGTGMSLAQKLAKLHSTSAPIPEGYDSPQFGFPVTTCCGDTPQDNRFSSTWTDFFGRNRLLAILERSEERNGHDPELRRIVERTVREVVPRLLGAGQVATARPVVVHGDLWSGNKGRGIFIGRNRHHADEAGPVEEVFFDPSASYAIGEYDAGIMGMFGGFSTVLKEYHTLTPKLEPAEEYEDRVALYECYHRLNHHAIFGGGYRSGAVSVLKKLLKKYEAS